MELQYRNSSGFLTPAGEAIQKQIIEWRKAITQIISYTPATSLAGALVQLAIALDEFDALDPVEPETPKQRELHQLRITRLITSAMRVVHESLGAEVESVFVEIYQISDGFWLDDMPRWAAEGRAARLESERAK